MEEGRHAESHFLARLEPVAAPQEVSCPQFVLGTFALTRHERQRRRAFGPLFPQPVDPVIDVFELRHGRAPIAEYGGDLRRGPLLARNREDFPQARRNRVGYDIRRAGDAEAVAAEVMILVVIRIPTAVILHQAKIQYHAVGEGEGFFRNEHGLPRLVAPARPGVDAPRRVVLADTAWGIDA